MEDLKIVYLAPDALKPYGKNARKHGERDVDAICASIRENGFCDPIGIWGPENLIVEGHGRQIAALRLGLDAVPCIRLDHLTDEQRREYALAHNKTAELSGWDFGTLESELSELEELFNMEDFGFEDVNGNGLQTDDAQIPENLDAEDEPDEKTVIRLVFPDFRSYKPHEEEIKDFANTIGASVTVGK